MCGVAIRKHKFRSVTKQDGTTKQEQFPDRRQCSARHAAVCNPHFYQQFVPAAVQRGRLADCGQLFGRRGAGGSWFFRQPDFPLDRLCERRSAGCRCADCPLLWRKGLGEPGKSHPHHGGAGPGRRGSADGCGRDFDPADPALDGHAGGCYRQLGRLLPHLLFGFHCSGHVQCGCQHSAIGRQQPQPYEVPDYSIAH